jgi:protein-S-isoprenylcysteine O-methyltransferase Ste14
MHTDRKSLVFLGLQILATAFILISGPLFIQNIPFLLMQAIGILLIFWALLARKVNKPVHIANAPKGSFLVMKGPYEIIRHPIYAGILLIMAGFVEGYLSIPRLFAFAIILAGTILKLEYDENILKDHYHDFEAYRAHTYRFIPYFY